MISKDSLYFNIRNRDILRSQKSRSSTKLKVKKPNLPWKNLGEYIHSYPREIRIQKELENARIQRIREAREIERKKEIKKKNIK